MISYLVGVHPQLSQSGFQMHGSLMGIGSHNSIVVGLKHFKCPFEVFCLLQWYCKIRPSKICMVTNINDRANEDNYIIDELVDHNQDWTHEYSLQMFYM
jgi:hypothetical protein